MRTDYTTTRRRRAERGGGFSLIEMLVVLVIIGTLAAITLPALKGMRKSNVVDSAMRQLLDDLTLARRLAVSSRTPVHVLFVPPEIATWNFAGADPATLQVVNRLLNAPFRGYALYADRSMGDQPGRPTQRYLTSWRLLPEGMMIAASEFTNLFNFALSPYERPFEYVNRPFPTEDGPILPVPHIAFDAQGRLFYEAGNATFQNEAIQLKEASVLTRRNPSNDQLLVYDVLEVGSTNLLNANFLVIDAFTGRGRMEQPELR